MHASDLGLIFEYVTGMSFNSFLDKVTEDFCKSLPIGEQKLRHRKRYLRMYARHKS